MPVVVVTPTYQEADNIGAVVVGVRQAVPGAEVVVVDDASPDGTAARAAAAGARVLSRPGKLGLGSAYVLGLGTALRDGHDPIVQMDADLSHDPAALPALLAALDAGADLVLGSRYVPGGGTLHWSLTRQLLSRAGGAYARAWTGLTVRDPTGGFKAWRAAALHAVDLGTVHSQGYAFQVETTVRAVAAGLRVVEVPIVFAERRAGRSKLSPAVALDAAWTVARLGR